MVKKSNFPIIGIVVILSIAYGRTLAPGLSWANGGADGGDLITAVAVNGVPHPTGYPLYLLIAKVFQWLPVGNLAFRTNLLSAFSTCFAAVMVYLTVNQILQNQKFSITASIIASLTFGLSPLVWSQAVITEVYGLQSLLTIIILYQTFFTGHSSIENLSRGITFGLALGNHITTILLFPFLLFEDDKMNTFSNSKLPVRILGLLLGCCVYLLLPLRAMNNPKINWNNPITVGSFFQLISGQIYQSNFSLDYVVDRIRAWAGILVDQFSVLGIFIGIYAIIDDQIIGKYKRPILWLFFSYGFFSLIYGTYDSDVYLIQTVLAFSLCIGLGFQKLILFITSRWHYAEPSLYPILLILFGLHIALVIPEVDASKDNRAIEFGKQVIKTSPYNSLIFTEDDQATFTLWYYHFAEKLRPDIKVVSVGLLQYDWYIQLLKDNYPLILIPDKLDLSAIDLINNNENYPYCFIENSDPILINCFCDHR